MPGFKRTASPRTWQVLAAMVTCMGASNLAHAYDYNWSCAGAGHYWDQSACWSPNGTPTPYSSVRISTVGAGDTTATIDSTTGTYLGGPATAYQLVIDTTASPNVTLNQSGSTLNTTYAVVGLVGHGAYDQTGGTHNVAGSLALGDNAGSNGTYTLSGGTLSNGGSEFIGYYGTGTFNQSGGAKQIYNSLRVAEGGGSIGTYNLSGTGKLTANEEAVGVAGNAHFNQSGGTNTVNTLYLNQAAPSSIGVYHLYAGTLTSGTEYIGYGGIGDFIQDGGTHTVTGTLHLGYQTGSAGDLHLNGGTLKVARIAKGPGYGRLYIDGGTLNLTGNSIAVDNVYVGHTAGKTGAFQLAGGKTLTTGGETIGEYGAGNFTQTGGTHTVSNGLHLGAHAGSAGSYALSGDGILTAGSELIGDGGTGSFTQTGGTNTVSNLLNLGFGGNGTYHLEGGVLDVAQMDLAPATANFKFTGGTLVAGLVSGNLANNGGTLSPGHDLGITTVLGDYSQNSGELLIQLGDVATAGSFIAGTDFDLVSVTGAADLAGTLKFSLWGGFVPTAGDSFTFLTADGGTTLDPTLNVVLDLSPYGLNYTLDNSGTALTLNISAVPEPATWLLMSLGLLTLIGLRRPRMQ